jgi:beta-mannanase
VQTFARLLRVAALVLLAVTMMPVSAEAAVRSNVPVPASGQSYLGAFTPSGPYDPAQIDDFVAAAGRVPTILMWFQSWGGSGNAFDAAQLNTVRARGAVPMISWEPWNWQRAGTPQRSYELSNIARGDFDTYVHRWATAARDWGHPMFLRFAQEMNATAVYPWAAFTNGNRPRDYVAAWRHVHDIFTSVGATNVSWVWSPSVLGAGRVPLRDVFPGRAYVDWLAADGYNGGTALSWGGWLSFRQLFASTFAAERRLAPGKPLMVAETASAEAGGHKAAWISHMFSWLATHPSVRAVVWFNQDKETDWRIQSSAAAAVAYAAGAASSRFASGAGVLTR